MQGLKQSVYQLAFRNWPTFVGVEKILKRCNLPDPGARTTTIKLKHFPLYFEFDPLTYMGMFLRYRKIYEEGIVKTVVSLLAKGDGFVDIGANAGLYSVVAAHVVGPTGTVVAVEPQAAVSRLLVKNVERNHLENVAVHCAAAGTVQRAGVIYQVSRTNDGQATMALGDNEEYFGTPEEISIQPADYFLSGMRGHDRVGVKIDVEGGEFDVLQGLLETPDVTVRPRFIVVECIEEHLIRFNHSVADVFSILWNSGYRIYCLFRGRWRPIMQIEDFSKYRRSSDIIALDTDVEVPRVSLFP